MRAIGIDPGTRTWDFVCLEDGNLILDETVPTGKVKKEPELVINLIKEFNPDLVNAPSGYGLPLKRIGDLNDGDFFQITLKKTFKKSFIKKKGANLGVTKVLGLMVENEIPAVVLPGVKHLPTVPVHRKINKIDMGTPDKVCSAAAGISTFDDREDASFILAEIGSAFNAFIAVECGKIVDGIGGTLASSGFRSSGGLDGEAAYLYDVEKENLFKGGFSYIKDKKLALDYFIEGIVKDIYSSASCMDAKTVLLSKSKEVPEVREELEKRIKMDIRELKGYAEASNAAQGAAIIVDGLGGGKYKALVDRMEIKNSSGSVFDYMLF